MPEQVFHARILCVAVFLLSLGAGSDTIQAQEHSSSSSSPTKIHGYIFGDYAYKLGGDSSGGISQYAGYPKDFQAFQIRRLYIFFEHAINERFFGQFIAESNDKTFDPAGKFGFVLKTGFFEWRNVLPNQSLSMGLVPTQMWMLSERIWNYRAVEKTVADYRGLGNFSDLGAALRGRSDSSGTLNYFFMVGNGTGQKPESNKLKKYYGELNVKVPGGLLLEGYADYEPGSAGGHNRTTLKGFLGFQHQDFTLGGEAVWQLQEKGTPEGEDRTPFGISVFAWAPVPGEEHRLSAFARYDYFDPNAKSAAPVVSLAGSADRYREQFVTAGIDYAPAPNAHLIPNIWINTYSTKSGSVAARDADVAARLTFFYIFQ